MSEIFVEIYPHCLFWIIDVNEWNSFDIDLLDEHHAMSSQLRKQRKTIYSHLLTFVITSFTIFNFVVDTMGTDYWGLWWSPKNLPHNYTQNKVRMCNLVETLHVSFTTIGLNYLDPIR